LILPSGGKVSAGREDVPDRLDGLGGSSDSDGAEGDDLLSVVAVRQMVRDAVNRETTSGGGAKTSGGIPLVVASGKRLAVNLCDDSDEDKL
jgi:hypothetical protein